MALRLHDPRGRAGNRGAPVGARIHLPGRHGLLLHVARREGRLGRGGGAAGSPGVVRGAGLRRGRGIRRHVHDPDRLQALLLGPERRDDHAARDDRLSPGSGVPGAYGWRGRAGAGAGDRGGGARPTGDASPGPRPKAASPARADGEGRGGGAQAVRVPDAAALPGVARLAAARLRQQLRRPPLRGRGARLRLELRQGHLCDDGIARAALARRRDVPLFL